MSMGVVMCALMAILPAGASADPEPFRDKADAARAGDPAASAPSVDLPEKFSYRGGTIEPTAAAAKGLVCNQDAKGVRCFDKASDAAADAGSPRYDRESTASAARQGYRARAASVYCSDYPQLHLFQYAQNSACIYSGNGWDLPLTGRQAWYNMGSYSNSASAYFMGNHSGHMSDFNDGLGYWVPYATGVGDYMLSLNGTSWSNRIDSRYRN